MITALAPVSLRALSVLRSHQPIVELFAGNGVWLRSMWEFGIEAIGFDISPGSEIVRRGDVAEACHCRTYASPTLLMIWPPDDGIAFRQAMSTWRGRTIISVGDTARFSGNSVGGWIQAKNQALYPSYKGCNEMVIWRRS